MSKRNPGFRDRGTWYKFDHKFDKLVTNGGLKKGEIIAFDDELLQARERAVERLGITRTEISRLAHRMLFVAIGVLPNSEPPDVLTEAISGQVVT